MDIQKTALRLPKDLHQMVSESARLAGHSMNAEIIARLRSSFEDAHGMTGNEEKMRQIAREVFEEMQGQAPNKKKP